MWSVSCSASSPEPTRVGHLKGTWGKQLEGAAYLRVEEVEVPPPGEGEVQIRIMALGLNRAESMFRSGQYLEEYRLPARLGYEAAGTVAAVGPGVQAFKVGDAVSVIPSFSLNEYGLYGELANAPAHAVTHHPASHAVCYWLPPLRGSRGNHQT